MLIQFYGTVDVFIHLFYISVNQINIFFNYALCLKVLVILALH